MSKHYCLLRDNYALNFTHIASSSDFDGGPFIVQILSGSEVGCVEIPTLDDVDQEESELFVVSAQSIGQDTSRVLVAIPSATVTIEDNDVVGEKLVMTVNLETGPIRVTFFF